MQCILNALASLDQAEALNQQSATLYFVRGILNFFLGRTAQASADLEKAIDKSEDNIAEYFYVRGLIYAQQKHFKSALNDLSIAINLNENYADAYIARAKCFHLLQDRNSAFLDL
jgi:Tfp pilus assembly protein PilF